MTSFSVLSKLSMGSVIIVHNSYKPENLKSLTMWRRPVKPPNNGSHCRWRRCQRYHRIRFHWSAPECDSSSGSFHPSPWSDSHWIGAASYGPFWGPVWKADLRSREDRDGWDTSGTCNKSQWGMSLVTWEETLTGLLEFVQFVKCQIELFWLIRRWAVVIKGTVCVCVCERVKDRENRMLNEVCYVYDLSFIFL